MSEVKLSLGPQYDEDVLIFGCLGIGFGLIMFFFYWWIGCVAVGLAIWVFQSPTILEVHKFEGRLFKCKVVLGLKTYEKVDIQSEGTFQLIRQETHSRVASRTSEMDIKSKDFVISFEGEGFKQHILTLKDYSLATDVLEFLGNSFNRPFRDIYWELCSQSMNNTSRR